MADVSSIGQKGTATVSFLMIGAAFIVIVHLLRAALTALKSLEREASRATTARDLMFHELQHRVLNNLQMITSTINMPKNAVEDARAKQVLASAIARIPIVASVQRKLSEQDGARVNIANHLRECLHDTAGISQGV